MLYPFELRAHVQNQLLRVSAHGSKSDLYPICTRFEFSTAIGFAPILRPGVDDIVLRDDCE